MANVGTVNSLVSELLTNGRAKANNVVKLLALLSTCKSEAALKAAVQGLKQFFVAAGQDGLLGNASVSGAGLRPAKRQKVTEAPGAAASKQPDSAAAVAPAATAEDPEAQYRDWLIRQYGKFIDQLLCVVTGAAEPPLARPPAPAAPAVAVAARSAGVQVVAAAAVMECVRSELGPGVFSGALYSRLLSGVLLSSGARPEVFALLFTKYLPLADVRYFTLTTVKAIAARYGAREAQQQTAAADEPEDDEDTAAAAAAATAAVASAAAASSSGPDGAAAAVGLPDMVRNAYDVLCHVAETLPPDCCEWTTWCGAAEYNLVVAAPDRNEASKKKKQRNLEQQKQQLAGGPAQQPQTAKVKWANPKTQRRLYGDAWLALLALPLPAELLRKALVRLPTSVLPHMNSPHMLADFLTHCLDGGGLTGMLALNGLFLLVSRHGLEYPQFFARLYQLLVPEVFTARTRAQFFRLADIFLSSPLVPAYTVAAFVKRFARLALAAPPAGAMVSIAFCHNLIRRHPALAVMLHNPAAAAAAPADVSAAGANVGAPERSTNASVGDAGTNRGRAAAVAGPGFDPYDEAEADPAKSRAVESSLWEVEALRSHYCPQVSTFCAVLDKDLTDRTKTAEANIEDILGAAKSEGGSAGGAGSYHALIHSELERKLRKAPVAFYSQPPVSLFQRNLVAEDFGGWAL